MAADETGTPSGDASAGAGPTSGTKQRIVSVSRVIPASPSTIFAIVDDPSRHPEMDGSGTVKRSRTESRHLTRGDRFGMDMKMGFPYRVASKVEEYEKDRLIAWAHFAGHRWRYELEPVDGGTKVTESFDWSTAKAPAVIELLGFPKKHPRAMEATLERLEALAVADERAAGG
ncbi:MAG: SRPBCC family protein [Actinomycetota bacterium]|nr:SRPBCC family protein [Actinomycetota bacterium]